MDNGRELYGFGCAVILLWRFEFVDRLFCNPAMDSFGQDPLSVLTLSPSAAAAASLTKHI